MSIFSRMTDIVNSNLTALLDKAEDPKKMIRLIIQEMEGTLVEVRTSSARVIADRKTLSRKLGRMQDDISGWEARAELAVSKGRDDLARAALSEKKMLEQDCVSLSEELVQLDAHLAHLQEEIEQLQVKLQDAKAKQKAVNLRHTSVQNRLRVKRAVHREALDAAFAKFDQFERRVDDLEGQLEAMSLGDSQRQDLADEFEALAQNDALNAELETLKERMASLKQ